jgi:hypothetical protein
MSYVHVTCGSCERSSCIVKCVECGASIALSNLVAADDARRARVNDMIRKLEPTKLEALETFLRTV